MEKNEDSSPAPTFEWNAASYHRVATPHLTWGQTILARLPLRGDETVIDAGCGSGRLTADLLARLPHGRVIAIDRSANMLRQAEQALRPEYGDRVQFVQSDLLSLDLDRVADAVFSGATFHWIPDHPRLFAVLFRALKPGGWLAAQCGGQGNLDALLARARALMAAPRFAAAFAGWPGPWIFPDPATTAQRLRAVGFTDVSTDLEAAPVTMPDAATYREFLTTVIFGTHLARLASDELRERFVDELTEQAATMTRPYLLDYVRLNLQGGKAARRGSEEEGPITAGE